MGKYIWEITKAAARNVPHWRGSVIRAGTIYQY
jgi:hypothetical protein